MEMLGNPSWRWGLSLIVLTMTIHSAALLIMAFVGTRIRVQLETRRRRQWSMIALQICAAAYLWVGALDSPTDALLYSVDSMSTLGATGLALQRPWQLMGGLEAVNGMILFGVSTAYVVAVMQLYWSMLAKYVTPSNG